MAITFVPQRGMILICNYDMARVRPEMSKSRRVIVVSPRSYNGRHGTGPGRCLVVPLSATEPPIVTPARVPFPAGDYWSLAVPTWAICDALTSVSHSRLDRVFAAGKFFSESLTAADMERIEQGLRHALGLASRGP